MSLLRVTFAFQTLHALSDLKPSEQSVIVYLLSRRNLRRFPHRPTAYLSYNDISESTALKPTTVKNVVSRLVRTGWIVELSRRRRDGVISFVWDVIKVREELDATFEDEKEDLQVVDVNIFSADDGKQWRIGGLYGYQLRLSETSPWGDTQNVPDEVLQHFGT